MLFATIDITERAGDAFKHALGVGHIVVAEECTLRSHVGQGNHRTVVGNGVLLLGNLEHFMERDGRNVERLLEITIIEVIVCAVFAHVGAHAN